MFLKRQSIEPKSKDFMRVLNKLIEEIEKANAGFGAVF
jgi:hypothetical protein